MTSIKLQDLLKQEKEEAEPKKVSKEERKKMLKMTDWLVKDSLACEESDEEFKLTEDEQITLVRDGIEEENMIKRMKVCLSQNVTN